MDFVRLFRADEGRRGVTVTFVAMLELLREGLIEIVQSEAYGPLHVRLGNPARHLKLVADDDAAHRCRGQRRPGEKPMNDQYVRNVIEAALLAAGRPLAADELVGLFDERDGSVAEEVHTAIAALHTEYETRGIELVEVASGYRIQIRSAVAQPVSRLWQERPAKYSRALLETLALVAYRQPITRGEIEQIRGVAVNPNIIKTLLERGWIRVIGHRDVPGQPRAARHHARVPRLLRSAEARRPADARTAQGARGSARAALAPGCRACRRIDRAGRR